MSKDEAAGHAQSVGPMPGASARADQDAPGQQGSAGSLLREARQSQGMDIDTLAALLKVPVRKLQALEENRFDVLTDPVFARALAASVCRILKLDSAPVLQRLPVITAFKVTSQNRGINTPFRPRTGRHAAPLWTHVSRSALLVGMVLLLGALVLIFLPNIQQAIARYRESEQGAVVHRETGGAASVTTTVTTQVPDGGNAAGNEGGVGSSSASMQPAESAPFVSTPAAPALPSSGSAAINAVPLVNFNARNASRIKVTDATGTVLLNRVLRAGESVSVSGTLPLATVVSRADAVQVQVRGQSFDLAGVSRNNVARFEVK